jgi:hypothetical protein
MPSIFRYGPYSVVTHHGALGPGAEHTWIFGPWDWGGFVVEMTATPFSLTGKERHLQVTRVSSQVGPTGERFVWVTVRNIGADRANYIMWLGGIQP